MNKFLDVLTGKSSLWPMGRSDVMPTNNTLASSTNFGLPFVSYFAFKDIPYWHSLSGLKSYFNWFVSNPVFYTVIMIKAREYANMRFQVKNKNTGNIEPANTRKTIPAKIYRLLNNPNVMQKRWEFLKQRKIFIEVCGNAFTYANAPFAMRPTIENVQALWNVWPQYMEFKLAGGYFEATQIEDVIKSWQFKFGNYEKEFKPSEIMHQNAPNIDPNAGLVFGTPTACSLTRPLTNIDMAYESRNVIMQNRGMDVIFTSDKGDATGKIALQQQEKDLLQEEMKGYGLREGQKQFLFSSLPIKVTPVSRDVRKLGLFDEITSDTKVVGNAFGVPTDLIDLSLNGRTYENQEASVRRLYQGALIPESEDDVISINNYFGLVDTEWEVIGSFDHVPALQKSKSEEATSNKVTSEFMERLFWIGGITLNQWLRALELDEIPNGNRRITDMTPEEQEMLLRMAGKGVTLNSQQPEEDGNSGGQQEEQ